MRRQVFIVVAFVLLLRLPFLDMPAQWDDFNYLAMGEYALKNPAHPAWFEFYFHGQKVDMRGHPHPPGVAWILAGLLAIWGGFREVPFHGSFLVFSLTAALSMLVLARRFAGGRALEATLLFLVVPASMVSGTSFESDLPLLALWMLGAALYVEAVERRSGRWLGGAAAAMAAAAMVAYTAFALSVICGVFLWMRRREWRAGWAALTAPFAVIAAYQLYERWTGGALPAGELIGHFQQHGYQRLEMKLMNGVALLGHLGMMVAPLVWIRAGGWGWAVFGVVALGAGWFDGHVLFWAPVGLGAMLVWAASRRAMSGDREDRFLGLWVVLYFAAAVVVFFAGAARYLLPLAAALALLAARGLADRPGWLRVAIAFNLVLGYSAAWVNAEHWRGSRTAAEEAMTLAQGGRVWTSAEWGARHYAERAGARPLPAGQKLSVGDFLLSTALSGHVEFGTGGNRMVKRMERLIRPSLPLRLAGLDGGAGYATVGFGLRAFGWSDEPVDRVTLWEAVGVDPTLSWVPMNAEGAEDHLVEGVYGLEQGSWRWAGRRSVYRLLGTGRPAALAAEVFVPERAPGRTVRLLVDGEMVAEQRLPGEGRHRIGSAILPARTGPVTVTLEIDRGFTPAGDRRELGLIVTALGFEAKP
ncbi:MAG: glycosyltransferase family 39 protein [Bryobacteraceae bacterium]|nr:glycosyltransferase family 39 protein [Solibacteraceae bacterium]MCO5350701.1 glycosyltransferase family 39 protein [Bryobacteraceae bacterium]